MVAFACLFEQSEMRVEIRLRVERGAVDAGQLRVPLVAEPVRTGVAGSFVSRFVRNWIRSPSRSGSRTSCTDPSVRTSTACSASFGPIARAASSPVAPAGSSSCVLSGRTTFMEEAKSNHPREDDKNEEVDESPVPDPEATDASAEDDPQAD